MGEAIAFTILAGLTVAASLYVVLSPHLFRSALALAVAFLGVAGLYILLHAEFVAAAQVLIYVGAITVLILFAVMLTSQIGTRLPEQPISQKVWALVGVGGIFGLMLSAILHRQWAVDPQASSGPALERIGQLLLSEFFLPFEVISVILLAVLIGAVVIARRDPEGRP